MKKVHVMEPFFLVLPFKRIVIYKGSPFFFPKVDKSRGGLVLGNKILNHAFKPAAALFLDRVTPFVMPCQ